MTIPPFLLKTYDLVSELSTDDIVSWSPGGDSFIVWNPPEFSKMLLPKHFKHNNFSSFVRQLNTYGFKKVDPDRWEFSNPDFQREHPDLLKNIQRRKGHTIQTSNAIISAGHPAVEVRVLPSSGCNADWVIEVGQYGGLVEEVESLKRDKNVLMMELVNLRTKQQDADQTMVAMKQRLERTERRLSQLITFFSNVASNPAVLTQMVSTAQQSKAYLAGSDERRKKRRHDDGDNRAPEGEAGDNQQLIAYQPVDVVSFFQQLLVSPLPEGAGQEPSETAALEEHFNGFNLRNQDEAVPLGGPAAVTIQDYVSPLNTPRQVHDPEIQIPTDIRAGVPSIGVSEGQEGGSRGNMFMPRPTSSAGASDVARNGVAEQAESFGARGSGVLNISGSSPLPPPPPGTSLSLDGLEGDLLGVDELQDMLKGAPTSLEYGQADADEWQAMLEDMSLNPSLHQPV